MNLLYAYDYDVETGSVSNRRTLVDAKQLGYGGYLDGLCVDTEGGIWSARLLVCHFKISYSDFSAGGETLESVDLPALVPWTLKSFSRKCSMSLRVVLAASCVLDLIFCLLIHD